MYFGGVAAIHVRPDGLIVGIADPRQEAAREDSKTMTDEITRRQLLRRAAGAAAALVLPFPLRACAPSPEDEPRAGAGTDAGAGADTAAAAGPADPEDLRRLREWTEDVRRAGLSSRDVPLGAAAARVGELAAGTPYEAYTLEAYILAGGQPARTEPLTLSLTRFDCVSLVESCLAIGRLAERGGAPTWQEFGREMERLRYRGGDRRGYLSRLHYFSEWISDNAERGGMRDLGQQLGGVADTRPLRFMTLNREAYPALADDEIYEGIAEIERGLDGQPRWVVPTARIAEVSDQLQTGDVVAFATSIEGLDVTHAAFAYRTGDGVLRVLHAPLSGGVVEVTRATLQEYVEAIRGSTGILVARPLRV